MASLLGTTPDNILLASCCSVVVRGIELTRYDMTYGNYFYSFEDVVSAIYPSVFLGGLDESLGLGMIGLCRLLVLIHLVFGG